LQLPQQEQPQQDQDEEMLVSHQDGIEGPQQDVVEGPQPMEGGFF
jgi:ubiquitin carboxyl-terminal hydrolase 7